MKFDKEYKNEMDLLSPSEEQLDRIKKGVYERIERENAEAANAPKLNKKPKKPLGIKIAAISGTACAAALMTAVIGIRWHFNNPSLSNNADNFINTSVKYDTNGFSGTDRIPTAEGNGQFIEPADAAGITGGSPGYDSLTNETEISGESVYIGVQSQPPEQDYLQPTQADTLQNAAPGSSSQSLYLSFSEDKESCTVTLNGKAAAYKKADFYGGFDENNISGVDSGGFRSAENDLGENLFVRFAENDLYVFYESGEFFGYYKAK